MSDDDADFRKREIERVVGFLKPRLDFAKRIYSLAMNSLWLGNAGAALATLSWCSVEGRDVSKNPRRNAVDHDTLA
jgi:hypothetical protein